MRSTSNAAIVAATKAPDTRHPLVDALVVISNTRESFTRAVDEHWYHLPLNKAPDALLAGQVQKIAFYLPKAFGADAFHVTYAVPLLAVTTTSRRDLFPRESDHKRADDNYLRLSLGTMERLPHPIPSRRLRRIVVIPTTQAKLEEAAEINDLFHSSPLEDRVWDALKQDEVPAEREYFVPGDHNGMYALDFAIFGQQRNLDVECDGDQYHATPLRARYDNRRNNYLTSRGWSVLRFDTTYIREELPEVMAQIRSAIRDCGGLAPVLMASAPSAAAPRQPALWATDEPGASAPVAMPPRRKRARAPRKGPPRVPVEQPTLW